MTRAPRRRLVVLAAALVVAASPGCGSGPDEEPATGDPATGDAARRLDRYRDGPRIAADEPAAMAVGADGSLYIGELRTGRVLRVPPDELDPAGATAEEPVAEEIAVLEVATEGQQGLLGLAVTADGDLLAGMTRAEPAPARQVVVRVVPGGDPDPVWVGPAVADEAIGGRIATTPDGRVLIGLGDFLRGPADGFGRDEPYSKLLSLDPDGPPEQEPLVVSEGWYNPFAFAVAPDGAVWVADNAPGDTPERIGRGDGGGPLRDMRDERAPSGLAVLGGDELAVCGVVSGLLELVPIVGDGVGAPEGVLADPCRLGVLALSDGRLAVALDDAVQILEPRRG